MTSRELVRGVGLGRTRTQLALGTCLLVLHALVAGGCVSYRPRAVDEVPFMERKVTQERDDVRVTVVALGAVEARQIFGVPLAKKNIQPVWIEMENQSAKPYLFFQRNIDSDYYAAAEAAYKSHFSGGKRFLAYGLAGILFFPLWLAAPFEYFSARRANRQMDELFAAQGIRNGILTPGHRIRGFFFTQVDEGTKNVNLRLLGSQTRMDFEFFTQVPGVKQDYHGVDFSALYPESNTIDLDTREALMRAVESLPCCSTNKGRSKNGDPLNIAVVSDLEHLIQTFTRAGWDETEPLELGTMWKTTKAFLTGSSYRYSPVSSLYAFGRKQDLAFQKARETIDERNHLRLWYTPLRHMGQTVWIGQVSRDIGVRFTTRTWNLTTHKIDPDLDDARETVMGDLIDTQLVPYVGYTGGVGVSSRDDPRKNLTGDPWYSDGGRGVAILSDERTQVQFFD